MTTAAPLWLNLTAADLTLIGAVSAQATVLAYLHHPFWKGFVYILPLPFTFAALALGQPVDATNLAGLALLAVYMHGVRWLYKTRRVPIVVAILASATAYAVLAWGLARVIPRTDRAFAAAVGITFALAAVGMRLHPHRDEPGHRTALPVWLKLPIIVGVIAVLVLLKQELRGFMTTFPMVGLLAAYEARHSLWTLCRKIPVLILATGAMMIVCRLTQDRLGLGEALAWGWLAYLAVMIPLMRQMWQGQTGEGAPPRTARNSG